MKSSTILDHRCSAGRSKLNSYRGILVLNYNHNYIGTNYILDVELLCQTNTVYSEQCIPFKKKGRSDRERTGEAAVSSSFNFSPVISYSMPHPVQLDALPPEILIHIFGGLESKVELVKIRLVCKNWHRLSHTRSLWYCPWFLYKIF